MVWGVPRQEGEREFEGERMGREKLGHMAQGRSYRSRTVKEVGWEGQERM